MTQRMEALAQANAVQGARANLKKDIRSGLTSAPDVVLSEIPDWLERMRVSDLVRSTHRMGRTNLLPILRQVSCSEVQQVGYLTERQRLLLAELLGDWIERQTPDRVAA